MSKITVDINKKRNRISPLLYGIFFEDINYGGDGGLYAELVANRSFEYYDRDNKTDKRMMCWESTGNAEICIKTEIPLNSVHKNYAFVKGEKESGIKNNGFCGEGFVVKDGQCFDFSCYVMAESETVLLVRIADRTGNVYGECEITADSDIWKKQECTLISHGNCKYAYLEIILKNGGEVNLEFVSLFPKDTFMGRKNGMRKDLCEMLKALSPKFMRFPGGCIVEGRSFDNMYCWKDTIGPVEERRTNWNRWQMEEYQREGRYSDDYFQSYGIGFYEYFQLCEDIGAKPLPVMNVGMTCQWHEGLLADMNKLDKWIDDILDLIEFANGDENTEYGKKRIEMGHKETFNLEYIGVGNEQWGEEYFERYEVFQKKISEKYPDIKLVTSAGWDSEGKEFDTAVQWMKNNKDKAYAVDEHFYKSPQWFLDNINRYDNYDRTMPKVFIGEYAAHTAQEIEKRRNNQKAAIAEAAFLTGVEKNADHVIMSCYAPLLAKSNHQQWQPNLIWFDNDSVYGTPSYYVQKLFCENTGEYCIECLCDDEDIKTSASITEDGRKLIIKAVNLSDKKKEVNFNDELKSGVLKEISSNPQDENSYDIHDKVSIKTKSADTLCTISPNSVNVIIFELY